MRIALINPVTRRITLNRQSSTTVLLDGVGVYENEIVLAGFSNLIRGGTFNGVISGGSDVGFSSEAGSDLVLNAANTYTGVTSTGGEVVQVNHPAALGDLAGTALPTAAASLV